MPKKIVYFCDVDHTLFNHDGEFRYNVKLFEMLKSAEVSELFLLTKMDVNYSRHQFIFKTRFELMQTLKKYHINVSGIFTTLDIRFEKTALQDKYAIGDAYKKYMFPVEKALFTVQQHLTNEEFNKYSEMLRKQEMINLIDYLVKNKFSFAQDINFIIDEDTSLVKLIELQSKLNQSIDNHFTRRYSKHDLSLLKLDEVNLTICATHFINNISYLLKEKDTINSIKMLKKFWCKEVAETNKNLDVEKKRIMENFYKKSCHYQNIMMLSYLRDKEIECSKGLVYRKILADLQFSKDNTLIIFIDDSKKEHENLIKYHPNHLPQCSLVCLHPTWNKKEAPAEGTDVCTSNLENYSELQQAVFLLQLWQSLDEMQSPRKIKNKDIIKPDIGNCFVEQDVFAGMQKISDFCQQMGAFMFKKPDYPLAASYFKIAYLYNKNKEKNKEIETNLQLALKDKGSKSPRFHLKPFYSKKSYEDAMLDIFKQLVEKINLLNDLELCKYFSDFLNQVASLCEEGSVEKKAHAKAAEEFLTLATVKLLDAEGPSNTTTTLSM